MQKKIAVFWCMVTVFCGGQVSAIGLKRAVSCVSRWLVVRRSISTENVPSLLCRGVWSRQISDEDKEGVSDLIVQVLEGDRERVLSLLDDGAEVNATGKYSRTPLMEATRGADVEMVQLLLKYGAKVNVADDHGLTPLMHASMSNFRITGESQSIMSLLLEYGAEVNAKTKYGQNVFDLLREYGDCEMANFIQKKYQELEKRDNFFYFLMRKN